MALSHHYWTGIFHGKFAPQLRAIVEALENRMLPAFAVIEEEAEAVSGEAWGVLMSAPATGDEDPADFAEVAEQAGVSHYMLLDGVRQGMLNLFAAALYHVFEQQIMLFLRKEVLHPREENNPKLFQMSKFLKRMKAAGIDITTFSSWAKVEELRLVTNTVKHAEGSATQRLHQMRPDLFENPHTTKFGFSLGNSVPRVFLPLAGEDLYVSLVDVQQYRDSLFQFWEELGNAISQKTGQGWE